jgi:hypothetical protein
MKLPFGGNRLIEATTVVPALNRFEGYRLDVDRVQLKSGKTSSVLVTAGVTNSRPFLDLSLLKACSDTYDISSNPKDYVFVEVPANNVDLPNRNMDCFPMEAVTAWRPTLGRLAYKTYVGKTFNQNHDNKIPHRAKGVIFDSYMKKINGHYHVMVIGGLCRQKDPRLAQTVYDGKEGGYSMACFVGRALCSVCKEASSGGNVSCKHVKGGFGKGTVWTATNELVYENCHDLNYHELSVVNDPADIDALKKWVHS